MALFFRRPLRRWTGPGNGERIVCLAVWTVMKDVPPSKLEDAEDVAEVWPDMNDRIFMASLGEDYAEPRSQAIKDSAVNGIYVLELLAVYPAYRHIIGAGTALVTWGTQAADTLHVKAVVEGTLAGRRLYENCGFVIEADKIFFQHAEKFPARPKPKLIFMVRKPVAY
ncbi:hypothetical protein F4803DRAFT_535469 [Xylaria telfairii]|nr:hypothetical protein F4803DRAFT_535469 [Xylaria telfairii]